MSRPASLIPFIKQATALCLFFLSIQAVPLFAEEGKTGYIVVCKNGDRLTASSIRPIEGTEDYEIVSNLFGTIRVKRDAIARYDKIMPQAEQPKPAVQNNAEDQSRWEGNVSFGYNKSTGNERSTSFLADASGKKKFLKGLYQAKGRINYKEEKGQMTRQKWLFSNALSLDIEESDWSFEYKIELDHDRFADIDYRVLPTIGLGYRFIDAEKEKLRATASLGYQYSKLISGPSDTTPMMVLGSSFRKKVFTNNEIIQEVALFPYLDDIGEIRARLEHAYTVPIKSRLRLKLSLITEYDSLAKVGVSKTDNTFATYLTYAF